MLIILSTTLNELEHMNLKIIFGVSIKTLVFKWSKLKEILKTQSDVGSAYLIPVEENMF